MGQIGGAQATPARIAITPDQAAALGSVREVPTRVAVAASAEDRAENQKAA